MRKIGIPATTMAAICGWLVAGLIAAKMAHLITGHRQSWVYAPFVIACVSVLFHGLRKKFKDDSR